MNDVSVVIITKNQERTICKSIESVLRLSDDIIVFIDNSSDDTLDLILKYDVKLIVNNNTPVGPGKARNEAARFARHKFILFIDGDIVVNPDFLIHAKQLIDHQTKLVKGVIVNKVYDSEWNLINTFRVGLSDAIGRTNKLKKIGGCILIEKEAFSEVSGFAENIMSLEESFLLWKLQKKYNATEIAIPLGSHHTLDYLNIGEILRHSKNNYFISYGVALKKAFRDDVFIEYVCLNFYLMLWVLLHFVIVSGILIGNIYISLFFLLYLVYRVVKEVDFLRGIYKIMYLYIMSYGLLVGVFSTIKVSFDRELLEYHGFE